MKWFYQTDHREVGPLTETALKELAASGVINEETPVRREDSTEWQPCSIAFSQTANPQQEPTPSSNSPLFKFECPHCQQHISADEDHSGKQVKCPTCGGDFIVNTAQEEAPTNTSSTNHTKAERISGMTEEENGQQYDSPTQDSRTNSLGKSAKPKEWKNLKINLAAFTGCLILTIATVVYYTYIKEVPPDITNQKSVERIVARSIDQKKVQIQKKEGHDLYCSTNGKPLTGWIKGTRYYRFSLPFGRSFGSDYVILLHVIDGKIEKEWSFYAGTTYLKQYEIAYDLSSDVEKHGKRGVVSFKSWKPNEMLCPITKVENGNGTVLEYDYYVFAELSGGLSNSDVDPPPTKRIQYLGGEIDSIEKLETEISRKHEELERKDTQKQENRGRTYEEIALRKNMQNIFPSISFEDLKTVVDDMFGETSNAKEERQRNRIFDDILMFVESTNTDKSEALENYKHWRETYSAELFDLSPHRFDFQCAKMVAEQLTDSMVAADLGAKGSISLGLDPKGNKSAFDIMNAICSYNLASNCKGYHEYKTLRDSVSRGNMSEQTMLDAKNILRRFEYAKSRAERDKVEIEARRFYALYEQSLSAKNNDKTRKSDQRDSVIEISDATQNSIDAPLPSLRVFQKFTIEEAKECIRLLDDELKNDPDNARIKLVKSTIMDVFRAEASLIAAINGQTNANKQYQIKMQNLQIASRPSPLTGKVNTAEVERIRRDAAEIKSSSESRINAAKADLHKSLDSAKRLIPAPDKDELSRVWNQIERRHNL